MLPGLVRMPGFAGGVMIAASYWSLLAPAIEMSEGHAIGDWFPAASGFLLGGIFLWGIDKILPHLHPNFPESVAVSIPLSREGMSQSNSFFYGQFSGMVEHIAAVIGAFASPFSNHCCHTL